MITYGSVLILLTCISSGALDSRISDHFPIYFLFKTKHQSEREICMFRIFNDMNYKKLKESIFSAYFSNILLTLDPNSAFRNFYDHLLLTYNRCFSNKKKISRKVNRSGWITPDLKFCIGKKYRLLNQLRNGQISVLDFNYYRNLLNSTIKKAKRLYFIKKSISCNRDARRTWRMVIDIISRGKL